MSEITKKIMQKVKDGAVMKIPKWRFIMKRMFVWSSLVVAIILGAFSISMIMFQLIKVDWDLLPKMAPMPFFEFMKLIPYFWLIIAGLLFTFVYFDFRNTRKGYRYNGTIIVIVGLLISAAFGTGIYFLKTPERADDFFRQIPVYRDMHPGRGDFWNVPDRGVLAGTILEIKNDKVVILEDFGKNTWTVDISEVKIPRKIGELVGEKVKAVGKVTGFAEFHA